MIESKIESLRDLEPEIDVVMATCINAWNTLSTERALGFGAVGPIPWRSIVEWCRFYYLDRDQTRLVVDVIRLLDNDRAEREIAKQRAEKNKPKRRGR